MRDRRRLAMTISDQLKADLISAIPNLRAFAVSLCGNPDRADDLVQETLVKAWSNLATFVEGTNMPAWLFTILRNIFYSEYRKRRREVADFGRRHRRQARDRAGAERSHGFPRLPRRLAKAPRRSTRSADPRRRLRFLLRGGGGGLRLCGRDDEEPCQSRPQPAGRSACDQFEHRLYLGLEPVLQARLHCCIR